VTLVGAGNRVELVSLLEEAARELELTLRISSIERTSRTPIASLVNVVTTKLDFHSPEFAEFLLEHLNGRPSLVLSLMDRAVASLAALGTNVVTPLTLDSAKVLNKQYLKTKCIENGIPVPKDVDFGPAHVRPLYGNGSVGTSTIYLDSASRRETNSFLYEEILTGVEVSVDAYVFTDGNFSAIARDRLRVVGGEVQHTRTRELTQTELQRMQKLLSIFTFRGPINVQFMGPLCKLLEINPRFGGGSTASIRAGWAAPKWLLTEYLLRLDCNYEAHAFEHVEVMRAWKDYVWREDGSNRS
jgi:hypothetical protein